MADYWITFRIHSNVTYQTRYDGLMKKLNEYGSGFWEGPTSFIAIRSVHSIDALAAALKIALLPTLDLLVIREIGKDNTRYIGEPGKGFSAFFPNAKKL